MKKRYKILICLLCLLVSVLMVFKYAEEILELKSNIYTAVSELRPSSKLPEQIYYEKMYASFAPFVHQEDAWYQSSNLIYHAGGGIDGLSYSNSKEAIQATMQHGRVIEMDFMFTLDSVLVCTHTWMDIADSSEPIAMSDFEALKIYGKYTPMSAEDLIDLMAQHEDIYIVVDTKESDAVSVVKELIRLSENRADIVERFIIQLYRPNMKPVFLDMYPFPDENFLFTCYKYGTDPQCVIGICMQENISVVTVPYGAWDADTVKLFTEKGIILFEHTVNRLDRAMTSIEKGIYGFYTDFLSMP